MNIPLLIFDIICLPITLSRIFLIYLFGSRYNIDKFKCLDILLHSNGPYFNQDTIPSIDTIDDNIRTVIKEETRLFSINNNISEIIDSKIINSEIIDSKIINSEIIDSEIIDSEIIDSKQINNFITKNEKIKSLISDDDFIEDKYINIESNYLDTDAIKSSEIMSDDSNSSNDIDTKSDYMEDESDSSDSPKFETDTENDNNKSISDNNVSGLLDQLIHNALDDLDN